MRAHAVRPSSHADLMSCSLLIGTSGWFYKHWLGKFYPPDMRLSETLPFYTLHFDTVEINNSFYALPGETTVSKWYNVTPPSFCFSAKASRYLTHMKRLKDPEETWERYALVMMNLGDKLGPILFQFPKNWGLNLERLAAFLSILPGGNRYVFEFRNHEWHIPAVYKLLNDFNAAFCLYEMNGVESGIELTADFTYVRLHSPATEYKGNFESKLLLPWAERIRIWQTSLKEIYFYFNNDAGGYAIENARKLKVLLGLAVTPLAI